MVPLIFGALADIVPDRVQADSGMLNLINVQGTTRDGRGVSSIFFASGGFGALAGPWTARRRTPSPSNMTGTSIEVWENLTGMFIARRRCCPTAAARGQLANHNRLAKRISPVAAFAYCSLPNSITWSPLVIKGTLLILIAFQIRRKPCGCPARPLNIRDNTAISVMS